ncbi:periplasmic binding protein [Ditylenchus destructor]|nr:periplasmic binding protein [Ditylenchus destructor]
MLLFGMINWTFTWLRPDGALTYDAVAPMVADLFFGGLGAVRTELTDPAARRERDTSPQYLIRSGSLEPGLDLDLAFLKNTFPRRRHETHREDPAGAGRRRADGRGRRRLGRHQRRRHGLGHGAAASLGIPEKNTFALMPKTIAGQKVNYIVLDDASDTTTAVANTRKLITEHKVDVVVGSTVTPNSLAMIDAVAEAQVPMISMAASARIVEPMDAKKKWVFKTPQNDIMMALAIASHMQAQGVKTVAYIGFADAYGEGWYGEFNKVAASKGLSIVANERYNRTDTSVTARC